MDWKLEVVVVPVTDVDRAKTFYVDKVGFHADVDARVSDDLRFVQLTPPGSACSIAIGQGITQAKPGSVEGLHLKEFFLLLSSTGLAYRRCELAWVNGDQIWVNFLKQGDKKKKARSTMTSA